MRTEICAAGEIIDRIDSIPPMPQQARQLLTAISDPEVEVKDLVTLIERSPPLAARIMSIACSAFFADRCPPRTVSDAVVRVLGLRLVCDLSLGIVLSGALRVDQCRGFKPQRYWRSAMETALLADRAWPLVAGGEDAPDVSPYLAGLLHNLGVLVLAHACPEPMSRAFDKVTSGAPASLHEAETSELGLDHAWAGARLARAWALPDVLCTVMAECTREGYRGSHWHLAATIGLCRLEVGGQADMQDEPTTARLEALQITSEAWCALIAAAEADRQATAEIAASLCGTQS